MSWATKSWKIFIDFSCKCEISVSDASFMQFSYWLNKVSSIHQIEDCKLSIFKDLQIETNLHKIIGGCKTRMWEKLKHCREIEADLHLIKLSNEISQTVRISTATFYWQSRAELCHRSPGISEFSYRFYETRKLFRRQQSWWPFLKISRSRRCVLSFNGFKCYQFLKAIKLNSKSLQEHKSINLNRIDENFTKRIT